MKPKLHVLKTARYYKDRAELEKEVLRLLSDSEKDVQAFKVQRTDDMLFEVEYTMTRRCTYEDH